MNIKSLIKAAEELNKKLGLSPAINLEGTEETLKKGLLEAYTMVEPDDNISKTTMTVIEKIEEEKEAASAPQETPEKIEEAPAEEVSAPKGKGKKKQDAAPEPPTEKEPVEEAPVKAKAPKAEGFIVKTRLHAATLAIIGCKGKPILTAVKMTDDIYAKNGGAENPNESKWAVKTALQVLAAAGIATVKDDTIN